MCIIINQSYHFRQVHFLIIDIAIIHGNTCSTDNGQAPRKHKALRLMDCSSASTSESDLKRRKQGSTRAPAHPTFCLVLCLVWCILYNHHHLLHLLVATTILMALGMRQKRKVTCKDYTKYTRNQLRYWFE